MTKILAMITAALGFLLYGLNKRYDKIKDQKNKAESKVDELKFINEKEKQTKDAKDNVSNDELVINELLDKQNSLRD